MRRAAAGVLLLTGLLAGCRSGSTKIVTVTVAGRPSAVTVAGGMVWVADDQRGVVVTLDENTGYVVGAPIKVGPSPVALASDVRTVWVADAAGRVQGIDMRTRRARDETMVSGGTPSGLAVAAGTLWITDVENGALVPRALGSHPGGPTPPVAIPDGAVRVAVDRGSVWVTNSDHTVTRVDARTLQLDSPIAVGHGPIGVAAHDGVVWVANSDDDTVSRIADGRATSTAHVPAAPVAVAAASDGAWVVSQDGLRLARLDPATGRVRQSIPIEARPRGVAVGRTRVWLVGVDPDEVIGVLRSALGGGA